MTSFKRAPRLLLFGILLAGLLFVGAADSEFARFSAFWNQNPCYADLVHRSKRNAHTLILGSSRVLMGIDPITLSRKQAVFGHTANLGHNERSYLVDRRLLEELIEEGSPKRVIIEAYVPSDRIYALERDVDYCSGSSCRESHSLDKRLASLVPYSEMPSYAGGNDSLGLRSAALLTVTKLDHFAALILSGRLIFQQTFAKRRFYPADGEVCLARKPDLWPRTPPAAVGIRAKYISAYRPSNHDDWLSWQPDPTTFLDGPSTAADRAELKKMVGLARRHGVEVTFLYLPTIYVPPPSSDFVRRFHAEIGAPLLVPPPRILLALQSGGFKDENHLNENGRQLVSAWLSEQIGR